MLLNLRQIALHSNEWRSPITSAFPIAAPDFGD
jgi:hypothetical protein